MKNHSIINANIEVPYGDNCFTIDNDGMATGCKFASSGRNCLIFDEKTPVFSVGQFEFSKKLKACIGSIQGY